MARGSSRWEEIGRADIRGVQWRSHRWGECICAYLRAYLPTNLYAYLQVNVNQWIGYLKCLGGQVSQCSVNSQVLMYSLQVSRNEFKPTRETLLRKMDEHNSIDIATRSRSGMGSA